MISYFRRANRNDVKREWRAPYLEVILSHGKTAKIDPDDSEIVRKNGPWRALCSKRGGTFYAYQSGRRGRAVSMHRLIMGFPEYPRFEVDHINGDGLDNRRINLEVVTGLVNNQRAHLRRKAAASSNA